MQKSSMNVREWTGGCYVVEMEMGGKYSEMQKFQWNGNVYLKVVEAVVEKKRACSTFWPCGIHVKWEEPGFN